MTPPLFKRTRYAIGPGCSTKEAILNSSTYDPIPLSSSEDLLHVAYPIPMMFLYEGLSVAEREDVNRHLVDIIEKNNVDGRVLDAVMITKSALDSIRAEDAFYRNKNATHTRDDMASRICQGYRHVNVRIDGSNSNVNDRSINVANDGSVRPRTYGTTKNTKPRRNPNISTADSSDHNHDTPRDDVSPTLSSMHPPSRRRQLSMSPIGEVESVLSEAHTAQKEKETKLIDLDRRMDELDSLIDRNNESGALKEARNASRKARRRISHARHPSATSHSAVMKAQAKVLAAEHITELKLNELAVRAAQCSLDRQQIGQQVPNTASEELVTDAEIARMTEMARAMRSQAPYIPSEQTVSDAEIVQMKEMAQNMRLEPNPSQVRESSRTVSFEDELFLPVASEQGTRRSRHYAETDPSRLPPPY